MKTKKTSFASYCLESEGNIPEGCKFCIEGRKLVLFVTGKCSRQCNYCSLSDKRKNKDIIWANELECKTPKEAVEEARKGNAKGAGITGGDPLLFLDRTLKYASALKEEFGKRFHIHIYLPTNLVTEEKLEKLSKYIDEVRFHPQFLQMNNKTQADKKNIELSMQKDIEKIKLASLFYKKENIGCEMPSFTEKKIDTIRFIKKAAEENAIGFVNLNELELSETNFNLFTKQYRFTENTYTISGSQKAALDILKACNGLGIKLHFCTARTKDSFQLRNRLKNRRILPFGIRNKDGTVNYYSFYQEKNKNSLNKIKKELMKEKIPYYSDNFKRRVIIDKKDLKKAMKAGKITKTLEYPTSDATEMEIEELS
jgi:pyruvate formate-lyase activating enzyme-like uncharacterized protein